MSTCLQNSGSVIRQVNEQRAAPLPLFVHAFARSPIAQSVALVACHARRLLHPNQMHGIAMTATAVVKIKYSTS